MRASTDYGFSGDGDYASAQILLAADFLPAPTLSSRIRRERERSAYLEARPQAIESVHRKAWELATWRGLRRVDGSVRGELDQTRGTRSGRT